MLQLFVTAKLREKFAIRGEGMKKGELSYIIRCTTILSCAKNFFVMTR